VKDTQLVDVRNARVVAGGSVILDDVSVGFHADRFNVILGPNGAGKSTLLKVATGLLVPDGGVVLYGGQKLSDFGALELARIRAVLSQHVELAFPLAVDDVVLMGRYPHYARVPAARDRIIVAEALALVGMWERRHQPYPTLSGGERQKVQLARVLAQIWRDEAAGQPRYLFLDEPTSNLDVHYQLHLLEVARSLVGKACTIVAILHDINVALQYGDRFIVMREGKVVRHTDSAADIDAALLEHVFGVRAHRVVDPVNADSFWRFGL
jgi:iron complex transport system ATP-binding protein